MPSQVVFNFNAQFLITQLIGRWYDIILPTIAVIACFIILAVDVRENGNKKHVYRYLIAFVAVAVCSYFSWVLIGIQTAGGAVGDKITMPWTIVLMFPVAYFFLANGVSLRDRMFRESSLYGFSWVAENPLVWQKTHVFGGRMSIFTGLVLFVLAVWNDIRLHTLWVYLIAFGVWLLFSFICVFIYSRKAYNTYSE